MIPTLIGFLLLFTALVSTIIFFTNICLCCCINEKQMEEKRCKIFCGLLTFFLLGRIITKSNFVAMIGTFSITIYWMGQLNGEVSQANCVLSKIPSDLLDGVSGNTFEFIGMTNYLDLMNNFLDESSKILSDNLSANFDNLLAAKIADEIKPYEDSLKNFKTNFDGMCY